MGGIWEEGDAFFKSLFCFSFNKISPSWARVVCKRTLSQIYFLRIIKFIHLFIHSFIHAFIYSLTHLLFIHSFIHSFIFSSFFFFFSFYFSLSSVFVLFFVLLSFFFSSSSFCPAVCQSVCHTFFIHQYSNTACIPFMEIL